MKGVQGGSAGGDDLALDGVVGVARRNLSAQRIADRGEGVDHVLGQLSHVETFARGLPGQVVARDRMHDVLKHSQRLFGRA